MALAPRPTSYVTFGSLIETYLCVEQVHGLLGDDLARLQPRARDHRLVVDVVDAACPCGAASVFQSGLFCHFWYSGPAGVRATNMMSGLFVTHVLERHMLSGVVALAAA